MTNQQAAEAVDAATTEKQQATAKQGPGKDQEHQDPGYSLIVWIVSCQGKSKQASSHFDRAPIQSIRAKAALNTAGQAPHEQGRLAFLFRTQGNGNAAMHPALGQGAPRAFCLF